MPAITRMKDRDLHGGGERIFQRIFIYCMHVYYTMQLEGRHASEHQNSLLLHNYMSTERLESGIYFVANTINALTCTVDVKENTIGIVCGFLWQDGLLVLDCIIMVWLYSYNPECQNFII